VVAQVPVRSETALVIGEEQCGIVVRPDDPRALANAIASLERDPDGVAEMGRRAFAAYRAKYTLKRAVDTFDRAFRKSGTAA
jgi:glycosyltransferase involved in cell wall biosynthesis